AGVEGVAERLVAGPKVHDVMTRGGGRGGGADLEFRAVVDGGRRVGERGVEVLVLDVAEGVGGAVAADDGDVRAVVLRQVGVGGGRGQDADPPHPAARPRSVEVVPTG